MSFFSRIFKKKNQVPSDLNDLGTDIHSHFLPALDDGSKSIEDSISMLREMHAFGYRKIITTPHIMGDFYQNSKETILPALDIVREACLKENLDLDISAAAEYYLDSDFGDKLKKKDELLTFGKNYLLFEVSYINAPDNLLESIFNIQMAGFIPVLAHPERYPFWFRNFEKYHELKDRGVLLQLNLNSLTGHYSPATKKIAERMIDENMIDFLGTDCHHMGHISLMKKVVFETHLKKLMESGRLLNQTL